MTDREQFLEIYQREITREGSDKLLDFLTGEYCDFFTAPASTRYHGACEGGLLRHSLNVYECLCDIVPRLHDRYGFEFPRESVAISALLHDLCKVNFYKTEMRNVKRNGVWEAVPYYTIEDNLPYGHGEKSVYMISGYMRLTRDEAFAIRYHMGFSNTDDTANVGKAFEMFPLALALSWADMEASYYKEGSIK